MTRKGFKIFSLIIFILAMAGLTVLAIPLIQSYNNPEAFEAFIQSYGTAGIFVMMLIQIAQIIVAIIPGELVEFVAGSLYGWLWGLVFCCVGIVIGQIIIFKLVRRFGKNLAEKIAGKASLSRFKFLNNEKKLKTVIFILFFIPGTPKDLITYVVPLTKIRLQDFLAISLVARIPSIISSTFAGDAFVEQNFLLVILVYGLILFGTLLGVLFYRGWIAKKEVATASEKEGTRRE